MEGGSQNAREGFFRQSQYREILDHRGASNARLRLSDTAAAIPAVKNCGGVVAVAQALIHSCQAGRRDFSTPC
jgi:hypothetical protein